MKLALRAPAFHRLADDEQVLVREWLRVACFDPKYVIGIEAASEDGMLDIVRLVEPFTVEGDELQTYRVSVKADGFPLRLMAPDEA